MLLDSSQLFAYLSCYNLNLQFHGVVRDACPNRKLVHLLETLGKQTLRYRHLAMSLPGRDLLRQNPQLA